MSGMGEVGHFAGRLCWFPELWEFCSVLFNIAVINATNTVIRDSMVEVIGVLLEGLKGGAAVTEGGYGPPRPRAFGVGTYSHWASKYWGGFSFSPSETSPWVASWQGG